MACAPHVWSMILNTDCVTLHANQICYVQEGFISAVVKRLMSDAPLAVLLSGGLDSSLVAAVAVRSAPHYHRVGISSFELALHCHATIANYIATTAYLHCLLHLKWTVIVFVSFCTSDA